MAIGFIGMRMAIPEEFDKVSYYGRGPHENYQDRKDSALIGIYKTEVDDLYFPYISPQENGNRSDIRWMSLTNEKEAGILIEGDPLLSMSALFYTQEDLSQSSRGTKHTIDLKKMDYISLNIDQKQRGVGGDDSWWSRPHSQYSLPAHDYHYRFRIKPLYEK